MRELSSRGTADIRLRSFICWALGLIIGGAAQAVTFADENPLAAQARESLRRGVEFFVNQVAAHGGYVYRYSADLSKQEGEGRTSRETAWVQPPGTPAVGEMLVLAYERTGEPICLAGAQAAAECLIQGQYCSGGWNGSVEFVPSERARHAYLVDSPKAKPRQRNISSLDDDKTQSVLRFLMQLDRCLEFRNERIHSATLKGLDALLAAQFPNGGWAQVWEGPADSTQPSNLRASFPQTWPRKYPGGDYWKFYTFNDNNISQVIETLWLADSVYQHPRYRNAILKAGDFILAAQLPEPQPAWAQQYNFDMQPVWARKFEPPAVSGSESQRLISTLLDLAAASGERKYLEPVPKAIAWLKRSQLPDGRMARFYELKTNKPLYMTREYQLTDSDADLPTHYGFQGESRISELEKKWQTVTRLLKKKTLQPMIYTASRVKDDKDAVTASQIKLIVKSQDARGAWVEEGRLQYYGKGDPTRQIIASQTFIHRIDELSAYVKAHQ